MNHVANRSKGFTIVELMMSMMFISILLIVIALTVIQISNIYNKGLTMKAVDQAGRDISTDMRLTLGQSQPFEVTGATSVYKPTTHGSDQVGGRLCTGVYSYIWNFGKFMTLQKNRYDTGSAQIRFVKARDNGGTYCSPSVSGALPDIKTDDAVELLAEGDRELAVQSFDITQLAKDGTTNQALYKIVMEIGTNQTDTLESNLTTLDTNCKPPSEIETYAAFCAVNRFEFTAQAGNRGGGR